MQLGPVEAARLQADVAEIVQAIDAHTADAIEALELMQMEISSGGSWGSTAESAVALLRATKAQAHATLALGLWCELAAVVLGAFAFPGFDLRASDEAEE